MHAREGVAADGAETGGPGGRRRRPFIGRDDVLERVASGLARSPRVGPAVGVVTGEPGLGKTRLATEVARLREGAGDLVVWVTCWDGAGTPPCWLWSMVARKLEPDSGGDLQKLVSGPVGSADPSTDPAIEQARFELAYIRSLAGRASGQPLLLVLEDLHLADPASLSLLRTMATSRSELPGLRLLLTFREREVRSDPIRHGLIVWTERLRIRERLVPLSREATGRLAAALTGRAEADVADAAWKWSRGVPLLVETHAAGFPTDRPTRGIGESMPERTRRYLEELLASLPEDLRATIAIAAACGPEASLADLAAVSERSEAEFVRRCRLDGTGQFLALDLSARRIAVSHPLIGQVALRALTPDRRAEVHRRVAERLRARTSSPLPAIAGHLRAAAREDGDVDEAVESSLEAGDEALARHAPGSALVHFEGARELVGASDPRMARVALGLGLAQRAGGNVPAARRHLLDAVRSARHHGSAGTLAQAVLALDTPWIPPPTPDREHLRLLDEAIEAIDGSPPDLDIRLRATRLRVSHWDQALGVRREEGERIVARARAHGDSATLLEALESYHLALLDPDHLEERLETIDELLRRSRRDGSIDRLIRTLRWKAHDLCEAGDLRAAEAARMEAVDLVDDEAQPLEAGLLYVVGSALAMARGELEAAEVLAVEARDRVMPIQPGGAGVRYLCQLYAIRRDQGRLAELREPFAGLVRQTPSTPIFQIALASIDAAAGNDEDARSCLARFARTGFEALPRDITWYCAMGMAVEVAVHLGDRAAARALYDQLAPYEDRAGVYGVTLSTIGSVAWPLGRLAEVFGDTDAALRHLDNACRRNRMSGCVPALAFAQADLARILVTLGGQETDRALALYDEAAATVARHGLRSLSPLPVPACEGVAHLAIGNGECRLEISGRSHRLPGLVGFRLLAGTLLRSGSAISATSLLEEVDETGAATSDPGHARVRVRKAIVRAIGKIASVEPELARALEREIRSGRELEHRPGRVRWIVTGGTAGP